MKKHISLILFLSSLFLVSCNESDVPIRESKQYLKVLTSLSNDQSKEVQRNLAGNASMPIKFLEDFAASEDNEIRASVASNLSTPIGLLNRLGNDSSFEVKLALVYNPNIPNDILRKLVFDTSEENVSYQAIIIPKLPEDLITALMKEPSKRRILFSNINLSSEYIEKLCIDSTIFEDTELVYNIASNPNTPLHLLEKLSNISYTTYDVNADSIVYYPYAMSLAYNPKLPVSIIQKLFSLDNYYCNDKMYSINELLASNPNTPVDILDIFSNNLNSKEYFEVPTNPNANFRILQKYFVSEFDWLRTSAVQNPNIVSDTLKILASNSDSAIRLGVALNPNTNIDDLEILSKDNDSEIRRAVALNTKLPINILERLAKDSVESVRASVADYQVMHITFYSDEIPFRSPK